MQRLSTDLRLGLEVASCFGSCVKCSVLDILSKSGQVDLQDVLQQASKRGFVDNVGGTMFRFVHDKIQQAAYESMRDMPWQSAQPPPPGGPRARCIRTC